jgi:hypothetical protein
MNVFWIFAAFLCLLLWLTHRPAEPMTLEFKVAGDPLKGLSSGVKTVLDEVKRQSDNLQSTAWSMVPFKDRVRRLHRNWRRK